MRVVSQTFPGSSHDRRALVPRNPRRCLTTRSWSLISLACCRSGSCPCECLQTARYSARSEISFSRLLVTHDLQKVLRVLRFRLFNSFHQIIQREVIDTIIARSSVIEASLLGSGFPVTRTMWGRWPFPLRIRFSASARLGLPDHRSMYQRGLVVVSFVNPRSETTSPLRVEMAPDRIRTALTAISMRDSLS